MTITYDSIIAQGALDVAHRDTMHIHWSLISACNYSCAYCPQPKSIDSNVFIRERIMPMAHKLLALARPYYAITLSGGEPTLHPHLEDSVAYFYRSRRKVGVNIETNGSRDIAYYRTLLACAPVHSLQITISVHAAFADPEHLLTLVAVIAEARQLAHVRLMFDPDQREQVQTLHTALTRLRAIVPFSLSVDALMQPANMSLVDARYTDQDRRWWQGAEAAFAQAVLAGPTAYASLPVATPSFMALHGEKPLALNMDAVVPNTKFAGFHCCTGTNFVHVDFDGRLYAAKCRMVPNNPPLWRMTDKAMQDVASVVTCRAEHCPGGPNAVLPKFRHAEGAEAYMADLKKRQLTYDWEQEPLINPVSGTPDMAQQVRMRLRRMQPLRTTIARIDPACMAVMVFGDVLKEAVQHYASMQPPLPHMPTFILVDWDGQKHEKWEATASAHQVVIVPMRDRATLTQQKYCLYGRENKHYAEWGCVHPLVQLCAAQGLHDGYYIDAKTVSILWKRQANVAFLSRRMDDIVTVYTALADEDSRDVFLRAMKSIETGDAGYLPISAYAQYNHPKVMAEAGDVVFEGGLASGGTTKAFAKQVATHGKVIGFEPLQKFYELSQNTTKDCPNVRLEHLGLWSGASTFYIEDNGDGSRMVAKPTPRSEECHSIDIDSYSKQNSEICSLLKLDIEGAEMECLKGALRTLRRDLPKLQISLYHHLDHYLDIPLWLLKNIPCYTLYMGHHMPWYSETCLYALPPQPVKRMPAPRPTDITLPLVSIIVPCHNNEDTLKRCLDSALIQRAEGMELIIIDDASTDSTPDIVAEYVRRYPSMVRSMRFNTNKGAGPARNAGMDMAQGQYMAFIDSDDMLAENFVQRGLEVMQTEDADIVSFDSTIAKLDKTEYLWGVETGIFAGEDALQGLLTEKLGHYAPYARLYKSNYLQRHAITFTDTKLYDGILFTAKAHYYSTKTVVIADVGYHKYLRANSSTQREHGDVHFIAYSQFVGLLTRFFEDNGLDTDATMYSHCVKRVYHSDRDKIFDAIRKAEEGKRALNLLTEERLLDLGSSKEALCCILADYALLHCHRKGLKPKVDPKHLDWQADAAAPRPPKTYSAYANADSQVGPAPLLTVIVPNYNKEKYLTKCFASIFAQSMQDFEVIIVDDCSTDSSYDMLMDYADVYPNVRLYRMDYNVRQGVCRNIGMDKARGTYVIFVDSDDMCMPRYFAVATETIVQHKADVVIMTSQTLHKDGSVQWNNAISPFRKTGHELALQYLSKSDVQPAPWAKIFDRHFLQRNACLYAEHVYHQDQNFFGKVLRSAHTIVGCDFLAYSCVASDDSTIRPAGRTYLHCESAYALYTYMQSYASAYHKSSELLEQVGTNHTLWNLENVLLQSCAAFWQATGSIPMTTKDHHLLRKGTLFLWSLMLGFAHCRAQGSVPQGTLTSFTNHRLQDFTAEACDSPLISVIIPTYNQEECIGRCLDSVLGQSLRSLEVIVINDASTDKTLDICNAYANQDPRVRVYNNERNMGQGYSRNWALELSRGGYITYVDSDDYILPNFLLRGLSLLENSPEASFIHFSYRREDIQGNVQKWERDASAIYTGHELLTLYCTGKVKAWAMWSKVYRRDFLCKNSIHSPSYLFEDNLFLLQAYFYAQNVIFIDEQGYVNVITPHDSSAINPHKLTPRHIDGILNLAHDVTLFLQRQCAKIDALKLTQAKVKDIFERFKQYLPYIASFAGKKVSPLSDTNMEHIAKTPVLYKKILEEYAKLYAQHTNYTPTLPPEDIDPLYVPKPPAGHLITLADQSSNSESVILSVIIPAYNVALYLARCLDSVLTQGVDGMEVIIVEDCSPKDETLSICQAYAEQHPCIRLFRTPWNSGLGTVRNLAMREAKGKYITFVDSDDWLAENFLPRGVALMEENADCDLIDFSWCAWDDTKNDAMFHKIMPDGLRVDCKEALNLYVQGTYSTYAAWAKMYRIQFLLKKSIFFSAQLNEDENFLLQCYAKAKQVRFADVLAYYYVRNAPTPTIMRPTYKGQEYFTSTLTNLRFAHDFLAAHCVDGENSSLYLQHIGNWNYRHGNYRDNLLRYIHACNTLYLPSPLNDEAMKTLSMSKEFIRNIIMDYAVLSQKKLPQQKKR